MEHLKNRPSFPFETIATALAFSPRIEGVLGEGKRLADLFGAHFVLIHVGQKTELKQQKLNKLFEKFSLNDQNCSVVWREGKPEKVILETCKERAVDLLLLGALVKEKGLNYYLGSVARTISRKAKTSVLLITDPQPHPESFSRIAVTGIDNPKTPNTIATAVYWAKQEKADELYVVKEIYLPGVNLGMADSTTDKEMADMRDKYAKKATERCNTIIQSIPDIGDIDIKNRVIFGKPGHSISNFARAKNSDLLVVNAPDKSLGWLDRLFPHDLEHILSDMPCNVLIVHTRGI